MAKNKQLREDKKKLENQVKSLITNFNEKHSDFTISKIDISHTLVNDVRKDSKIIVSVNVNAMLELL